jgi:hypothetical protein
VKDENGDLLADFPHFEQAEELLLSVFECIHSDVRQIVLHTAEPLIPDLSPFEVDIAIAKLKRCKSPVNDQIPAELTQTRGEILCSESHKLINSFWNKEEFPDQ